MIRLLLCLILIGGNAAMAAPKDVPSYDPMKQRVTPEGQTRAPEDGPSKAEMFLFMWRQQAGDKPIPENLRQKYGLPPATPQGQ